MPRPASKPTKKPTTPYGDKNTPIHTQGNWIWAPLKNEWRVKTPEEGVRQEFIYRLHTQWGYELAQMRQEVQTQRGRGGTRADVVVAETAQAATDNRDWIIVVEAKAENVPITPADYGQGESYARAVGAEFLVMHNDKETLFSRMVPGAPGERVEITAIPRANELGNARRLDEIRHSTKTFTREEFQKLLFECHSILRDNHKMDPGSAFDEISKILFIKMAFERQGHSEVFTTDALREVARIGLLAPDSDEVLERLFSNTKTYYKADKLFGGTDTLKVSMATFKRIVKKLEKFNLSDTGDDIKGIAFERFLGETFRGELGQFFTPRPLVDFMVELLDPQEGEVICDPASGTGGFLIRAFEYLREVVERDVQKGKVKATNKIKRTAKKEGRPEDWLAAELNEMQAAMNMHLDVTHHDSRMHHIAHDCIFGTDAEARAARTSKMNMIMHGDGHGGIHYHDGLLDVNGIYEERFDVVLTNPPFGANVGRDQVIGATDQTRVEADVEILNHYRQKHGERWEAAHDQLVAASSIPTPILSRFDIGRDPIGGPVGTSKVRPNRPTEQLFMERCLNLLKPGGRMAIVLPDGILNNPSLSWLREYIEGRARLLAVVSVPQEVFASSNATVKTSLVFLRRFTQIQVAEWGNARAQAATEAVAALSNERAEVENLLERALWFDRDDVAPLILEIDALTSAGAKKSAGLKVARAELRATLTPEDQVRAHELRREAASKTRHLDAVERTMIRARARELTSYQVFMAEAKSAGITSTGDTGPLVSNDLPGLIKEYRRFRADPDTYTLESAARLAGEM